MLESCGAAPGRSFIMRGHGTSSSRRGDALSGEDRLKSAHALDETWPFLIPPIACGARGIVLSGRKLLTERCTAHLRASPVFLLAAFPAPSRLIAIELR